MPIVNTKNNNKHNVVKNITPATSAKASIEFNFPWNVLVDSNFSSLGYFTSSPLALFSLKDIDLNSVSYIIDHKNNSDTAEYFFDDWVSIMNFICAQLIFNILFMHIGTKRSGTVDCC